jgi:PAS domain-containing protein
MLAAARREGRDSSGFDFTSYKRTSLMRRVRRRMDRAGYETFGEYLDVLQANSDELSSGSADQILRKRQRPLCVSQGSSASGDLRAQRSGPRCPDLAGRPAGVPQHTDVPERRNTTKCVGVPTFCLTPDGILFLGHAKMLLSHSDRFAPLDLKHRVFRKAAGTHSGPERCDAATAMANRHGDLAGLTTVRELAFRASPVTQIVLTGDGTVAMINHQAESLFGLSARDIGRLLPDLEISYRPVELEVTWNRPSSNGGRRGSRTSAGSVRVAKPSASRSTSTRSSTPTTRCCGCRSSSSM